MSASLSRPAPTSSTSLITPISAPRSNYLTSPLFGASDPDARFLARRRRRQTGGLNPLYQIGGPRSVQLALKLDVLIWGDFVKYFTRPFLIDVERGV